MAFAARYSGTYTNRKKETVTITIEKDGWTDPVETITWTSVFIDYSPEKNQLFNLLWNDTITLEAKPDSNGISPFKSIINAEEREYKIVVNAGIVGTAEFWLKPSQIQFARDGSGVTKLIGVGGLNFLKDETYAQQTSPSLILYSGVSSLFDILERGLISTGLDYDFIFSWFDWYARSTGGYEADGNDSLKHLGVDNSIFTEVDDSQEDETRNPFTMYEVIRNQIAAGCDLQIHAWFGQWYMMQRRRSVDLALNQQDLFVDSTLSTGPAVDTFFFDLDWINGFRLQGMQEAHTQARLSSSITYNHGLPELAVIGNPGFDAAEINPVGGSADQQWRKGGTNSEIGTREAVGVLGTSCAYMNARLNSIQVVDVPDDIDAANNFFEQEAGLIEGGLGKKLTLQFQISVLYKDTIPLTDVVYFPVEISILGSSTTWKVFRDTDGLYKLSDSVPAGDEQLIFTYSKFQGVWNTVQIPIEELHDGSVATTGNLKIRCNQAIQDNVGQLPAVPGFIESRFDDFKFTITEASGETANTATKTTCTNSSSNNTNELEGPTVLFGSGPTSGHIRRLRVLDGGGAEDGDAANFQVGDDYTAPATGLSRDALYCDERLKQTGFPPGQLRGVIFMQNSFEYRPHMYLRDRRTARVNVFAASGVTDVNVRFDAVDGVHGRKDPGLLPGRPVTINAETKIIEEILVETDGTYTIRLDSSLSTNHSVDEAVVQDIYYSPRRLSYDVYETTVEGIWDEYYIGDGGDLIVETDIKPGSPEAANITSSLGNIIVNLTSGGAGGGGLDVVEDIDELRALAGTGASPVWLKSVVNGRRLGSGLWIADEGDTTSPDDTGTIVAGSDSVRWKRQGVENVYRTEWFGAVWDGVTDDQAAIQLCIDNAPGGSVIELPARQTVINGGSLDCNGKIVRLQGAAPTHPSDEGAEALPAEPSGTVIKSGDTITAPLLLIRDTVTTLNLTSAVSVDSIHFIGNADATVNEGTETDSNAIRIESGVGVRISNCSVTYFNGDGIQVLGDSDSVRITDTYSSLNGGNGIYIASGNSKVEGCNLSFNTENGIFETLSGAGNNFYTNNTAESNTGSGFNLNGSDGHTHVHGNHSVNNGSAGFIIGNGIDVNSRFTILGNMALGNGTDDSNPTANRSGFSLYITQESTMVGNISSNNRGHGFYLTGDYELSMSSNVGAGNFQTFTNLDTQTLSPGGFYSAIEFGLDQSEKDHGVILQALISSLPVGATILFPRGSFRIDTTVVISSAVRLKGWNTERPGDTDGTRFTHGASLDGPTLTLADGSDGSSLEGISFDGVSTGLTASTGLSIQSGAQNIRIDRCNFAGYADYGVRLEAGSNTVHITSSKATLNLGGGFFVSGFNHLINSCNVNLNGFANNIDVSNGERVRIVNCLIEFSGGRGIEISGGIGVQVQHNYIHQHPQAGIHILSGDRHAVHSNNLDQNGTGLSGADSTGIHIASGSNLSIQNNQVTDSQTTATQEFGITIGAALSEVNTILNNSFAGLVTGKYSIDAASGDKLVIDLEEAFTIDLPSIASGDVHEEDITMSGVLPGDGIYLGAPGGLEGDLIAFAFSDLADSIKLRVYNPGTTVDPASGDWIIHARRRLPGVSVVVPPPPPPTDYILQVQFKNENLLFHG